MGLLAVHVAHSRASASELRGPIEGILLALTSVSAIVVVVFGLMLANVEADDSTELFRHRWLGVATAVGSVVVAALFIRQRRADAASTRLATPYRIALAALAVLMGATGHYGGSMTHGRGFLTAYAPFVGSRAQAATVQPDDGDGEPFDLAPILTIVERHCLKCHNESKHRGGMRLDTWPGEFAPGKSGRPVVVAGEPFSSEMVRRITLPEDHDDAMPPEGRDRVPGEDVLAIFHWIQRGATGLTMPVAATSAVPDSITRDEFTARIAELGGQTQPFDTNPDLLAVDLGGAATVTNTTVSSLIGGQPWIAELNLTGARINDAALETVASLTQLQTLTLDQTPITDDGIMWLADMPNLRKLSVRGTRVTEDGIDSLMLENPELSIDVD